MPNDRKLAWAHAIRYSISLTREPLSLKFTRFTQYIYKMQTTPNKVIINKL